MAIHVLGCTHGSEGNRRTGVKSPPVAVQIADVRTGKSMRVIAECPLSDAEWESLRGLAGLRALVLERGVADDGRVDVVASLPDLERLVLRESPLTDAGFERLSACTNLRDLNVPQAACTPAGIRALAGLEHLRSLRLGGTRLAGAEVCAAIATLPGLQTLHLIDVPIGDEGLRILSRVDCLRTLYLDGAGVSDDAWTEYFESRPDVHVHIDQAHRDPARGLRPFADASRTDWHVVPKPERKGVQLRDMTPAQEQAALQLLGAALSEVGYDKARTIMSLDEILRRLEGSRAKNIHDPKRYFFTVFGTLEPGIGHGYRIEGPSFVVEFVNNQPDAEGDPANHIHCIWRDTTGDFDLTVR